MRELYELGTIYGFTILTGPSRYGDDIPEVYLRGTHTYQVNFNTQNPIGTIYSMEHILRSFESVIEAERKGIARKEKELADYIAQQNRPFEEEEQLRQLLIQQEEMNRKLDLDKSETQVIAEEDEEKEGDVEWVKQRSRRGREKKAS